MPITAKNVIDSIRRWCSGSYVVIEETGIAVEGRVDALLIPVSFTADCMKSAKNRTGLIRERFPLYKTHSFFNRPKLVGVEIKVSRSDFKKGLETDQFVRYDKNLSGIYVAGPKDLFKTSELPEGIGHLCVFEKCGELKCVCKRHPKYTDVDLEKDVPWRIMFKVFEECNRMVFREIKRLHKL